MCRTDSLEERKRIFHPYARNMDFLSLAARFSTNAATSGGERDIIRELQVDQLPYTLIILITTPSRIHHQYHTNLRRACPLYCCPKQGHARVLEAVLSIPEIRYTGHGRTPSAT